MQRNPSFDIMKGIGILAVIAGHSVDTVGISLFVWKLIYSFHMPMFFILAGYFYKESPNTGHKFITDFRRLIVPYLVTACLFIGWSLLTDTHFLERLKYLIAGIVWASGEVHFSALWYDMPRIGVLWFLPALFWCRTFYNLIAIHSKHPQVVVIVVALLASLADRLFINLPFALLPGLSAMIFYLAGHYLHSFSIRQYWLFLCLPFWVAHLLFSRLDMCTCYYRYYPIDILGAIFATWMVFLLSKRINKTLIANPLSQIGQASLTILCVHALERQFIDYSSWPLFSNSWILFFVSTFICLFLSFTFLFFKSKIFK